MKGKEVLIGYEEVVSFVLKPPWIGVHILGPASTAKETTPDSKENQETKGVGQHLDKPPESSTNKSPDSGPRNLDAKRFWGNVNLKQPKGKKLKRLGGKIKGGQHSPDSKQKHISTYFNNVGAAAGASNNQISVKNQAGVTNSQGKLSTLEGPGQMGLGSVYK